MAKIIDPSEYIGLLNCPCPERGPLYIEGNEAVCQACKRRYPVKEGIVNFVDPGGLDSDKLREFKAHDYELTKERIAHFVAKDAWSSFYSHFSDRKLKYLLRHLDATGCSEFFSLGVGTGFELKKILSTGRRFKNIYASDLSGSALKVVPHTLAQFDARVGLFTSDLDHCPVGVKEVPVVIYEAMHHTSDMHATIEGLLSRGYRDIIFVEPTTNLIVKLLSRLGLAEREEYSGLKPKWLDLKKLKRLCGRYGYRAHVTTMWDIPEEYFKKIWKRGGAPQEAFLAVTDAFSLVTGLFKAGSFSIVRLRKA